ncbi:MAG: ABC transporter substrate-binding protein [Candidatus Hermodarchaeota archaeon]
MKSSFNFTPEFIKHIAIIILGGFLITSIIFNVILFNQIVNPTKIPEDKKEILTVGFWHHPSYWYEDEYGLDPLNAYDTGSMTIIRQIAEGLYMYDYTKPSLPRIPMLAADDGVWEDNFTWTVRLRENICFHDNVKFNATAVKWTFDRLLWFLNSSGEIYYPMRIMKHKTLYLLPNGTSIINEIIINSEYSVSFKLNSPFGPIKDLLCHSSASILSPRSIPNGEYIHMRYGDIVGTGPFLYDNYVEGIIRLRCWESYWRAKAYFDDLIFKDMDWETRYNAMLNKEIDFLLDHDMEYYSIFEEDPSITCDNSVVGVNYQGLILSNDNFSSTWRKAISYAINYSSIIQDWPIDAIRANNPLTSEYFGYDPSAKAPSYNLTRAREIVVGMGFGDMSWSEEQWANANFYDCVFGFFRTTRHFSANLFNNLNLDSIGLDVIDGSACWAYWEPDWHWAEYDMYLLSFNPDYLDPINLFYNVFSSKAPYYTSYYGFASNPECNYFISLVDAKNPYFNNSWLEQKYLEAMSDINDISRAIKYAELQHILTEDIFPNVFLCHSNVYTVHSSDLKNVPYNPLNVFYAWQIYR